MRKILRALVTVVFIIMTSCEKQEIKPAKPIPKDKLIECKKCEGGWDFTVPEDSTSNSSPYGD